MGFQLPFPQLVSLPDFWTINSISNHIPKGTSWELDMTRHDTKKKSGRPCLTCLNGWPCRCWCWCYIDWEKGMVSIPKLVYLWSNHLFVIRDGFFRIHGFAPFDLEASKWENFPLVDEDLNVRRTQPLQNSGFGFFKVGWNNRVS